MRGKSADLKDGRRVVRGKISSSGGIVSGDGFVAARIGIGGYTITFLPPFKAPPDVFFTNMSGADYYSAIDTTVTEKLVTVQIGKPSAGGADAAFNFRAEESIPA